MFIKIILRPPQSCFHSIEPHPMDWREKSNCPCGGWHYWTRFGEIGKCHLFIHHLHPLHEPYVTVMSCGMSCRKPWLRAGFLMFSHLGSLCSVDVTGFFRREFVTRAAHWRGEIRVRQQSRADGTIKLIQKNGEGAGIWSRGMRERHLKWTPSLHLDQAVLM